jgi:hypothetical protein
MNREVEHMDNEHSNAPLLASPFAGLRAEMDKLDTPRWVEKELMQAFAKEFPPRRRWWQRMTTPAWSIAGSFCSAALVVLVFALAPRVPPHAGDLDTRPLAGRDAGGAFIALDSLERIEQEPSPQLIETEVPSTALAALGVPVTPDTAGDSVRAEMLVAADGHPLALRLTSLD